MAYAPCKNPNCNSYGQPHPNCKCYGEMAGGGDVTFCSSTRAHDKSCQYFAEGGSPAPAPSTEFDDLTPDADTAPEEPQQSTEFDDLVADPEPQQSTEFDDLVPDQGPAPTIAEDTPTSRPQDADDDKSWLDKRLQGTRADPLYGQPGHSGDSPKDYEEAFRVGSLITGGGVVAGSGKVAQAASEYLRLGKIGSGVLKGALANGMIQTTDEASKMMMGENHDHPVAAVIAATGLGGFFGGIGSSLGSFATKKLDSIKNTKLGNAAASFLAGLGTAANKKKGEASSKVQHALGGEHFDQDAYVAGQKYFEKVFGVPQKAAATVGGYEGAKRGYAEHGVEGALKQGGMGALKGYALGKTLGFGAKAATPIIIKILSSQSTSGILDALNHFEKVSNGVDRIDGAVESLFGGAARGADAAIDVLESDKKRKQLEDYIEGGGPDADVQQGIYDQNEQASPQGYAKGGDVQPIHPRTNGVAEHFPEQNILMHAAKARAGSYLNSLRPGKDHPKLAFDDAPEDSEKKKVYGRALDIATSPLKVMEEIRKGTIEPEHIKHLNSMFPEVTDLLHKKLTERITKAQLNGEKPSYKVRQGLSLFLGTPLSGEMTPQNIQAAQSVFAMKKAAQQQTSQPGSAPKKNTSKLSKSDRSYLTDDQARESRQQRQT